MKISWTTKSPVIGSGPFMAISTPVIRWSGSRRQYPKPISCSIKSDHNRSNRLESLYVTAMCPVSFPNANMRPNISGRSIFSIDSGLFKVVHHDFPVIDVRPYWIGSLGGVRQFQGPRRGMQAVGFDCPARGGCFEGEPGYATSIPYLRIE